MTTVLELITDVRDMLDEPVASQWSDAQLKKWLSEANRDIARTTHHYKTTDVLTLTASVAEYSLLPDIVSIEHAYYDDLTGQPRPLQPKHYEQMDGIWGTRQNWGGVWPGFFTTWGHQPTLRIRFFPVPQVTGHKANLLYSCLPMPLGANGDQVEVPGAWYDALADYATWKAFLRDQNPLAEAYRQAYVGKRDQMLHNNEYIATPREMIADPWASTGYVPPWLAMDPYY